MAKMITRTVTIYVYTFGKFNPETMTVEGMVKIERPYKMGDREKRKYATGGKLLLAETESTALYGMSIDDFVKYAKPMDGTENGDAEKEGDK